MIENKCEAGTIISVSRRRFELAVQTGMAESTLIIQHEPKETVRLAELMQEEKEMLFYFTETGRSSGALK